MSVKVILRSFESFIFGLDQKKIESSLVIFDHFSKNFSKHFLKHSKEFSNMNSNRNINSEINLVDLGLFKSLKF